MSDKFKITETEINEVVLNSPYSLADSPASLGQRAKQIKKYFYSFIYTLAEKINLHLDEIEDSILRGEALISELEGRAGELGDKIESQLAQHNVSGTAHADIRQKISEEINKHNQSALSHTDIQKRVEEIEKISRLAYAVSSGKSRVHTFDDVLEMLEFISQGEVFVGDILLIADPHSPDFTVFEVGAQKRPDDIELGYQEVSSGELVPEPERSYFVNGTRLISTDGNLETSRLAKREELEKIEGELYEYIERNDDRLSEHEDLVNAKEDMLIKTENTGTSVEISKGHEYNLGQRSELSLSILPSEDFYAIINFRSGQVPTSLDAPADLIFQGDDTLDGAFYPVSNRIYEINVKEIMGAKIARVCATDYEVIE